MKTRMATQNQSWVPATGEVAPLLPQLLMGKKKPFADGFGLCSPGRWPPALRRSAASTPALGLMEALGAELEKLLRSHCDVRKLAMQLAAGKVVGSPFSDAAIAEGRELIFLTLELAGTQLPVREHVPNSPFLFAAIEELLRISQDPDYKAYFSSSQSFAKGVRVGVGAKLPRVPAVFERKEKWRRYAEESLDAQTRENYISATQQANVVQEQFLAEAELGAMVEMRLDEAQERFDNLVIASLGAIEKKDGTYRVIHDGTHGINVNSSIRVRDQLRNPTAGDLRTLLRLMPGAFFALTGDVKRAHRLVKMSEQDWGLQACRTGVHGEDWIWLNTVGTFGISSAAYHWGRLMAGLGRLTYYMWGQAEMALLVFVDDLLWMTREKGGIERIVVSIFFFVILGLPFSWKKFAGGLQLSWVGFTIDLESCALGLSVGRATWAMKWLRDRAAEGKARVADMCAVLGRLSFALSALDHLRPFLGPIYAWIAALEHARVYKLPKAIKLIMLFLAKALEGSGRLTLVRALAPQREVFRTDARAEGDEIWIGGWALDDADTRKCRWFSEKLSRANAPWLYAAGEAYRQIASLELLATLAAVVTFGLPSDATCHMSCSAGTDNRGNSFVVSRLLTTKFPLCAFLMELALQLHSRRVNLDLYWLPRLQNTEADELTNDCTVRFDPKFRVRFDLQNFEGLILGEMLDAGVQLYEEIKNSKLCCAENRKQKVRKIDALRQTDPWV